MGRIIRLMSQLASDEQGAALIEYTVLLGVLLVGVIVTIALVGGWVNTNWTTLQKQLT